MNYKKRFGLLQKWSGNLQEGILYRQGDNTLRIMIYYVNSQRKPFSRIKQFLTKNAFGIKYRFAKNKIAIFQEYCSKIGFLIFFRMKSFKKIIFCKTGCICKKKIAFFF